MIKINFESIGAPEKFVERPIGFQFESIGALKRFDWMRECENPQEVFNEYP